MGVKIREYLGNLGWVVLAFITLISISHSCSKACEANEEANKLKEINERNRQILD